MIYSFRDGKEQGPRPPCLDAWLHAYGKSIDTYYESKKKRHDLSMLEYENIDFSESGENIFVDMLSLIEKAITSSGYTQIKERKSKIQLRFKIAMT